MKQLIWIIVLSVTLMWFSFAQNDDSDKKMIRLKLENKVHNNQDKILTGNNNNSFSSGSTIPLSEDNQRALKKVEFFVQWKLKLVKLVENTANKVKLLAVRIWYDTDKINDLISQIHIVKQEYLNFSNYIIENKLNKQQINEKVKEYNNIMKIIIESLKDELKNLKEFIKSRK